MDPEPVLKDIGLDAKEAKVYLSLLALGQATATKLAAETVLDRTLMYQITNRLIEKGLASYLVKENVRYFRAADPETLLENLKHKQEKLEKILPALKLRQQIVKPKNKVEVYQGRKGITTIFRMILKDKEEYHITGGAHEACTMFKLENTIFVKRAEEAGIKGKILARKIDNFFVGKNESFRFIPEGLISSTTMCLWGHKTALFVWSDPYYAILIENPEVTKGNLSTFRYLWRISEEPSDDEKRNRRLKLT